MPRKTLREGAAIIDPEEDYMTIAAAEEQMSLTEAARKKDVDQAKTKLRGCYTPPRNVMLRGLIIYLLQNSHEY